MFCLHRCEGMRTNRHVGRIDNCDGNVNVIVES